MTQPAQQLGDTKQDRYFWGFWEIAISSDHQSIDLVPDRTTDIHLNAVRLLEETACTDCLTISNIELLPDNKLAIDLTVRHPYPGQLKFTAFDVRGVFMSGADYTFPLNARSIASGDGNPLMLNADGYTSLFNPTEFPETSPPALGYIPGNKATGGDLSATLNPFVAYSQDAERRMFESGSQETRTVMLTLPDGPVEFGYAVDACWTLVDGEITDPLTDFPPEANCHEAYDVSVIIRNELAAETWSYMPVRVEVFDHQGLDSISTVSIEAPDFFAGEKQLGFLETIPEGGFLFGGLISNELQATPGLYPLLIHVVDKESDPNLGNVDAWNVYPVRVTRGWAQWWDGYISKGPKIALGPAGEIYSTGAFMSQYEPADLEPGPGQQLIWTDLSATFLNKFDSTGQFLWVKVWDGPDECPPFDIATDITGAVYVVGNFRGSVDFDPGTGIEERTSNGYYDAYISCFDSDGTFQWVRSFGSPLYDSVAAVAVSADGGLYISGLFRGTVDFDPGPAVDERTPIGAADCFLSKFTPDGEFQWVRAWGGSAWDRCLNLAVTGDNGIAVVGAYLNTCDFDPGPGLAERTSSGITDCFLTTFDSVGNFKDVLTWGGPDPDSAESIALDNSGNVIVAGQFKGTADFDPGPGVDSRTAAYYGDAFISKFSPSGEHLWVRTWSTNDIWSSWQMDSTIDNDGNIYSMGVFKSEVDFDPGPGEDIHSSDH